MNRLARTALEIFDSILAKDRLDKKDLEFLIERITVYEDRIDIQLKADVDALLHVSQSEAIEQAANGEEITYNPPAHSPVREKTVTVVSGGDPLEIYTDHDGEVVLKKYSPDRGDCGHRQGLHRIALSDAGACGAHQRPGRSGFVVGRGQAGVCRRRRSAARWIRFCRTGRVVVLNQSAGAKMLPVTGDDRAESYTAQIIAPILADGEIIGGLMLLSRESGASMTDVDRKVAETTANIVGKQMEQ